MTNAIAVHNLSLLMHDHNRIKQVSIDTQTILDQWTEDGHAERLADMEELIQKLCQLTDEHVKHEEELLFPLLKDMYTADVEMVQYLKAEHQRLLERISDIIACCDSARTDSGRDWHTAVDPKLSGFIDDLLEHMYTEEHALYPLILRYAKQIRH